MSRSGPAALLGLLHDGPQTGGDLVTAARDRFGSFFSVTRSQVYRELPALAEAGFVRLGKQGPRSSQQYVITAAGNKMEIWDSKKHKQLFDAFSSESFSDLGQQVMGGSQQ